MSAAARQLEAFYRVHGFTLMTVAEPEVGRMVRAIRPPPEGIEANDTADATAASSGQVVRQMVPVIRTDEFDNCYFDLANNRRLPASMVDAWRYY